MAKSRLDATDRARILTSYLPYGVQLQRNGAPFRRGTLEELDYVDWAKPATLRMHLGGTCAGNDIKWDFLDVNQVLPVLYTMADLPLLPPRPGESFRTPLSILLGKMNFLTGLDEGAGEAIGEVEVEPSGRSRANEVLLTLQVHTTYTDPHSWEVGEGADYGVSISAYGEVRWRNITADNRSPDAKIRTAGQWHNLYGTWLLEAFDFLRELHVAVGEVATTERHTNPDTLESSDVYRYIRKELPVAPSSNQVIEEGGPADG